MRRILILILILMLTILVQAQAETSFTCLDETTHLTQFTITPPDISEFVTDITVTALGRGNYEPIIGISTADDFTDCYAYSPEAEFYDLSLPTGDIPSSISNASGVVYNPGTNSIQIAEANNNQGAMVLSLEAIIFEEDHTYQLNLSEAMLAAADTPLNVYLVSLLPEYEPSLTMLDADGTETIAETSDVSLLSFYGEGISAVAAPLPETAGNVELIVNADVLGIYALIIELQSGEIQVGDGVATVTTSEDGSLSLTCDSETIFDNGMRVYLPDDNDYTATILANPTDAVLAVADDADSGFCYDDSLEAVAYSVDLPIITLEQDIVNPQGIVTSENDSIVFGGRESAAGSYVLIIEGGEVSSEEDGDIFEILLTPQMLLAADIMQAYVFTTDVNLDPILTWEVEDGEVVVCNDAGFTDFCDQEVESFSESLVTLGDGLILNGLDINPMLEIPIDLTSDATSVHLRVTAADETSGTYLLVLHIVTN